MLEGSKQLRSWWNRSSDHAGLLQRAAQLGWQARPWHVLWHPALACRLASPGLDGETTLAGHHLHPLSIHCKFCPPAASGLTTTLAYSPASFLTTRPRPVTTFPFFGFLLFFRFAGFLFVGRPTALVATPLLLSWAASTTANARSWPPHSAISFSIPHCTGRRRVSHHPTFTTPPPTTLNYPSILRMGDTTAPRQYVPLTCHGHSRPVPHLSFSPLEKEDVYYMISACKGSRRIHPRRRCSH